MYRKFVFISALLLLVLQSECWDQQDITHRIIFLAVGFDESPGGKVRVSLQLPIVEELLIVPSGASVAAKPFCLISAEGTSAFSTVPELNSKTQRSLFFGHIKAVVFNTSLAKRGLKGPTDSLRRHTSFPPQAFLLLTDEDTRKFLNFTLMNKQIPSSSMVKFFQVSAKQEQAFAQRTWEFHRNINAKTQDAYIPMVRYDSKEKTFLTKGLGVFHGDRMVGELSGEETRMFGLLLGKTKNAYFSIPTQKFGRLTFRKVKAKPRATIHRAGKQMVFQINLSLQGFLAESTQGKDQLTPADIKLVERETARHLKREMVKTIGHLQQLNSDILALGEIFRATYPREWAKADWDKVYPEAEIQVSVKFNLFHIGTML